MRHTDNTARNVPVPAASSVPVAPESASKARAKTLKPRLPKKPLVDPASKNAKQEIAKMFPRVTKNICVASHDPEVMAALAKHVGLGVQVGKLDDERDVEANKIRLAIGGHAGVEAGDYMATWEERKGGVDGPAIIIANHAKSEDFVRDAVQKGKAAGLAPDAIYESIATTLPLLLSAHHAECLAKAKAHDSIEAGDFCKEGSRTLLSKHVGETDG